ncbi:MAG: hypothetical protein ACYS29_01070, partial [Planctomycetota bacterium]
MNKKQYCQSLIDFKSDGIRFRLYIGTRWLILKVIIAAAACFMLSRPDELSKTAGTVLLGYLFGVVIANVRTYIFTKAKWKLLKDLIQWKKVEEILASPMLNSSETNINTQSFQDKPGDRSSEHHAQTMSPQSPEDEPKPAGDIVYVIPRKEQMLLSLQLTVRRREFIMVSLVLLVVAAVSYIRTGG